MKSKKRRKPPKTKVDMNPVERDHALTRYRKMMMKLLNDNCSKYSWGSEIYSHLRADDWPSVYIWAGSATTVVYSDAQEHYCANQIAALVLKYPHNWKDLGLPESPESCAKASFYKAERLCRLTNKRFRTLRYRKTSYRPQLEYMRAWIHSLLGQKPDLKSIYQQCGFSSGAALGVHGNATNLFRKIHAEGWSVNPKARDYALHALWSNDQILFSFMEEKNGYVCYDYELARERMVNKCIEKSFNKISFVPKTVKTHRGIAVEPLLNSYIQSGIDSDLRRKLKDRGYDLTSQEKNKYLSRVGSSKGNLATMDLSSASDTISIELVRYLLPWEWFDLLNRTRSGCFSMDGEIRPYEKFVSMGNGFCFPLETIIFIAAVRASIALCSDTSESRFTHSVYGDDIIVPTPVYKPLSKLLGYCGFIVNPQKSFNNGPFRESCGADWYLGQDVRPVYLKHHLTDDSRLMILHNATYRGTRQSRFFESVRHMLREWVPYKQRMCRPLWAQPVIRHEFSWIEIMACNGAFSVEMDLFQGSHFASWDRRIYNWTWTELLTQPVEDKDIEPPDKSHYQRSQYLSLLQGSPGGRLNLRRKVRLSLKNNKSSDAVT